jgi:triacylglycerol lipase
MFRRLVSAALVGLLAIPPGCKGTDERAERCHELQEELSHCTGGSLGRLDCSAVSVSDIERLSSLTHGGSCAVIAGALPGDGDLLSATCRILGIGCVQALTPAPELEPTRWPILLVNGIDTSPLFRWSSRIVSTMREAGGHDVHLATLTPYQPPRVRAPELWKRIEEVRAETGAARVNLICHSLGGLDCRYLVSPNGLTLDLGVDAASSVASISTVGTAHHGTRVADVALGLTPDADSARVVNDLAGVLGDWFGPVALQHDVQLRDALRALSIANAPAFNDEIVDAENVFYQSWAGYSRPFGRATPSHDDALRTLCAPSEPENDADGLPELSRHDYMALALVPFVDTAGRATDGGEIEPSDGLTSVRSARWGTFRGCIPADHMEQLGARNLPDVNVRTGFDVARFYTNVAGDLAKRGF